MYVSSVEKSRFRLFKHFIPDPGVILIYESAVILVSGKYFLFKKEKKDYLRGDIT